MKRVLFFVLVYSLCSSVASFACDKNAESALQEGVDCKKVQDGFNQIAIALAAEEYCDYKLGDFDKSEFLVLVSKENNKDLGEFVQMIKQHGSDKEVFAKGRAKYASKSMFCLWNEQVLLALGVSVKK